jgi:hypothetical protein
MTAHDHKAVSEALERLQLGVNELRQKCKSGGVDCEICETHQQAHDTLRAELEKLRQRCEALEAALLEIADFKGDPNTPIRNSVNKSGIARRALTLAAIDRAGGGES